MTLFIQACLALLFVVSTTVLPHHHHGSEVCMVVERCWKDGNVNDHHTGHAGGNCNNDAPCKIQALRAVHSGVGSWQHSHTPYPLTAFLPERNDCPSPYYINHSVRYTWAEAAPVSAVSDTSVPRAPPVA